MKILQAIAIFKAFLEHSHPRGATMITPEFREASDLLRKYNIDIDLANEILEELNEVPE